MQTTASEYTGGVAHAPIAVVVVVVVSIRLFVLLLVPRGVLTLKGLGAREHIYPIFRSFQKQKRDIESKLSLFLPLLLFSHTYTLQLGKKGRKKKEDIFFLPSLFLSFLSILFFASFAKQREREKNIYP